MTLGISDHRQRSRAPIFGDQLAITKETGRRLGMGTNMYPSLSLLEQNKDASIAALPINELIEKAYGFAGVFLEHKYDIVKKLQEKKHICGMTGYGVNDAPSLKKADIGIVVADTTDAARGAYDIVLVYNGSHQMHKIVNYRVCRKGKGLIRQVPVWLTISYTKGRGQDP